MRSVITERGNITMRSPKLSMKKKTAVFVSAGIMTVAAAGAAFAYWTNTGSGDGSATTGTNVAITVNQTDSSDDALFPGGPATTLSGNFDNPNASQVYVASVTATIDTFSHQADDTKPACTEDDFQLDTASVPVAAEVNDGIAVGSWSGIELSMINDPLENQDNCKNVTVPLSFTSN